MFLSPSSARPKKQTLGCRRLTLPTHPPLFFLLLSSFPPFPSSLSMLIRESGVTTAALIMALQEPSLEEDGGLMEEVLGGFNLCLGDFGFAKQYISEGEENSLHTPCGTVGFVAPEIALSQGYGRAVDMWSLGVTMYTMLVGFPPFYADTDAGLLDLIAKGTFSFPSPWWDSVSDSAKHLVRFLIEKDSAKRISAEQLLVHPFLDVERQQSQSAYYAGGVLGGKLEKHARGEKSGLRISADGQPIMMGGNADGSFDDEHIALREWEAQVQMEQMMNNRLSSSIPETLSGDDTIEFASRLTFSGASSAENSANGFENDDEALMQAVLGAHPDGALWLSGTPTTDSPTFPPFFEPSPLQFELTPLAETDNSPALSPKSPKSLVEPIDVLSRSIDTLRDSFSMDVAPPPVTLASPVESTLWQRRRGKGSPQEEQKSFDSL
jgi:serine/threonine protein kinase